LPAAGSSSGIALGGGAEEPVERSAGGWALTPANMHAAPPKAAKVQIVAFIAPDSPRRLFRRAR